MPQRPPDEDMTPRAHHTPTDARYDAPFLRPRQLLAELLGTFALTLVAAGGPVIGAASGTAVGLPALVVAPALLVIAMIYTVGNLSGAHFNPAVTLAFALRKDFPWRLVPGYCATQLVGATLAALLLRALFGRVGQLGATLPHLGARSPTRASADRWRSPWHPMAGWRMWSTMRITRSPMWPRD